jgi:hypothetical protein
VAALLYLLLYLRTLSALAGPQDEITRRDFAIGGFKPPPRWEVLPRERQSYPQLLAWASSGETTDRAVITLVGKRVPHGTTLQTFLAESTALREYPRAQNVRVQVQFSKGWPTNQRLQIDATLGTAGAKTQRPQVLRQFIYLNPPFGYVLTLVAPQEQAAARYRDLDDTTANLVPLPPLPAASQTAPAQAPAPAAPAAGQGPGPGLGPAGPPVQPGAAQPARSDPPDKQKDLKDQKDPGSQKDQKDQKDPSGPPDHAGPADAGS